MVAILDTEVHLEYPLGHHLHCLVAQLPVRLRRGEHGFTLVDPERHWHLVRSVLDLVADGEQNLKKLHFLVLPEAAVPAARLDDVLDAVAARFRPSTVTAFGMEHLRVRDYRALLARFERDNAEALALVQRDVDSGDVLDLPVNAACVAVKEASGRLRVFLEAKTHPFRGEEFVDAWQDLYRGRHLWLLRGRPACFNCMVLVCLDYLWRDLYASNARRIIDHANRLFFTERQTLDALFVLQANPKPEHRAYRDVLSGFYGEYLEDTPGVRETVTVFANASAESALEGVDAAAGYGVSQVVIGGRHKLARIETPEFSTDDLGGAPVCRLRFGTGTRLYYFNLPLHHELDPRSSRLPLKVHAILRRDGERWTRVTGERIAEDLALEPGRARG
ncbi:hypothetical protein [Anaeromyxobacter oryzae]|uniref:Uncharacterized protein n=1 Tax=Anaeromyxobacter oryzae TaxID=2918170 RepID=A0ABM7X1N0_9BACT|nr:hypothetical protein [Anaeromyxobacter oryzae]BDG05689.1 hypothetical protein AMOR_46850 [Anaeromyxobacter oryzae]